MKEKITYIKDPVKTFYDNEHWKLFSRLRSEAFDIQKRLPVPSFVYGSLARGNVHAKSDIDIILFETIPSYQVEMDLDFLSREIVQATPNAPVKAHIHVTDQVTITFPLIDFTEIEMDFYRFSGCLPSEFTQSRKRVPGISKKLVLIQPLEDGHLERSLMDDPYECSKIIGVSQDIIAERIRVLTRRDKVGRTGVFLREDVAKNESFEGRLKSISDRNQYVRRNLKRRGWF